MTEIEILAGIMTKILARTGVYDEVFLMFRGNDLVVDGWVSLDPTELELVERLRAETEETK